MPSYCDLHKVQHQPKIATWVGLELVRSFPRLTEARYRGKNKIVSAKTKIIIMNTGVG